MNHLEVCEQENASLSGSASWELWLAELQDIADRAAGHSVNLDGDETEGDSFSLDGAWECFCAGNSAAHYAACTKLDESLSTHRCPFCDLPTAYPCQHSNEAAECDKP